MWVQAQSNQELRSVQLDLVLTAIVHEERALHLYDILDLEVCCSQSLLSYSPPVGTVNDVYSPPVNSEGEAATLTSQSWVLTSF